MTGWAYLQLSLQWIADAHSSSRDALAAGMRLALEP